MMDCNRDEALRAKEIAENKFNSKDFVGAKKFALKAQALFPGLEGIIQMVATLDVYLAAERRLNGEMDWYEILCVPPSADEETIKKQYRKLALQLHPDKNKAIGAEGAFQLISEAWGVLSDKSKKYLHDQKRGVKVFQQQKVFQAPKDQSVPNASNGAHKASQASNAPNGFTKTSSNSGAQKRSSAPRSDASYLKVDTFWTSCHRCKMQYEYLRIYVNMNLLCPNCKEPFLATETGIPSNVPKSSVSWSGSQHMQHNQNNIQNNHNNLSFKGAYGSGKSSGTIPCMGNIGAEGRKSTNYDGSMNSNFHCHTYSGNAAVASENVSAVAAAQANERIQREREEAARKEAAYRKATLKRTLANSTTVSGSNVADPNKLIRKRQRVNNEEVGNEGTSIGEKPSQGNGRIMINAVGFRNMLIERSKASIRSKLDEWNVRMAASKLAEKEKEKLKQKQKEAIDGKPVGGVSSDSVAKSKSQGSKGRGGEVLPSKKDSSDNCGSDSMGEEGVGLVTIDVPDPDFHDFDNDRSERSFDGDQMWATYDNEDGMPRFYVFVQKVVSRRPFKVRMSYLNSKSNSEFGQLNWVASGFPKTCGDFRLGRYAVNDTVNIFSHRVSFQKGPRGVIKIFPREGDTWALYRNWSPDWNESTPDEVIYKYDMVRVLRNYEEEGGVTVAPLVKVAGFKTVFQPHADPKEVRMIPREEMFRFSHQVPSHNLTGDESEKVPNGSLELDPAATPMDLLQVIAEAPEAADQVHETETTKI